MDSANGTDRSTEGRIRWTASNMALIGAIGREFAETKPFDGLRIGVSLHLLYDTGTARFGVYESTPRWQEPRARTLEQRDGGCTWDGCGAPVSWCDAHHIIHWANGNAFGVPWEFAPQLQGPKHASSTPNSSAAHTTQQPTQTSDHHLNRDAIVSFPLIPDTGQR